MNTMLGNKNIMPERTTLLCVPPGGLIGINGSLYIKTTHWMPVGKVNAVLCMKLDGSLKYFPELDNVGYYNHANCILNFHDIEVIQKEGVNK